MKSPIIYLVIIFVLLLPLCSAIAQWSASPKVNLPIRVSPEGQGSPFTVSDDSGGAIITWTEPIGGRHSVHAQKVNSLGFLQWGEKGIEVVPVEPASKSRAPFGARVTSTPDGHGGIISIWYSHDYLFRNDEEDSRDGIYGARISPHGEKVWGNETAVICSTYNGGSRRPNSNFAFTGDSHGGAYVGWLTGEDSLVVQRIDSLGRTTFPGGIAFPSNDYLHYQPTLCSDSSGGAFIIWGDSALQARKISLSGEVSEPITVTVKGVQGGLSQGSRVLPDGEGGVLIVWLEQDTPSSQGRDIRAQHLDHEGNILWGINGISVISFPGDQQNFKLCSDSSGGVIVAWADYRDSPTESHLYAQHVDRSGILKWSVNGLPVCIFPSSQYFIDICSNGSGGALIAWTDDRVNADIYIQKVLSNGFCEWTPDGIPVCSDSMGQADASMCSDHSGGAILCWADGRNGNQADLYGQRVFSNGALPVQLVELRIYSVETHIRLDWATLSESNNFGFRVERSSSPSSGFHSISFIPGNGTTLEKHEYHFNDSVSSSSEPFYRLGQLDLDGKESVSEVISVTTGMKEGTAAKEYALQQNYPNPFNPSTTIKFELPKTSQVTLTVYDILGRQVSVLVNERRNAGVHEVKSDGSNLASGVYFYRIQAGDFVSTKRMLVLK